MISFFSQGKTKLRKVIGFCSRSPGTQTHISTHKNIYTSILDILVFYFSLWSMWQNIQTHTQNIFFLLLSQSKNSFLWFIYWHIKESRTYNCPHKINISGHEIKRYRQSLNHKYVDEVGPSRCYRWRNTEIWGNVRAWT